MAPTGIPQSRMIVAIGLDATAWSVTELEHQEAPSVFGSLQVP